MMDLIPLHLGAETRWACHDAPLFLVIHLDPCINITRRIPTEASVLCKDAEASCRVPEPHIFAVLKGVGKRR